MEIRKGVHLEIGNYFRQQFTPAHKFLATGKLRVRNFVLRHAAKYKKSVLCLCSTDTILGDRVSQSRNPENVSKYYLALSVRNIKQDFC